MDTHQMYINRICQLADMAQEYGCQVDYQDRLTEEARGFVRIVGSKKLGFYSGEVQRYKDHYEVTVELPDTDPSFNRYGKNGRIQHWRHAVEVLDAAINLAYEQSLMIPQPELPVSAEDLFVEA